MSSNFFDRHRRAIGLNLQGISDEQARATQSDLESTKAKLDRGDFSGLTKQQMVGDLLYSTILSYMSLNDIQDKMAERQADSVGYRSPSYGLFKTSLSPVYWYGIPRDVKADGLGMDVDRMKNARVNSQNNEKKWEAFNRAQGVQMSAMEHFIPEEMFSTKSGAAESISAVKAIQIAGRKGQKVYTVSEDNLADTIKRLNQPARIEEEIRNAVRSGREVTTHQNPVRFQDSSITGYIVIDPETGGGAYKISISCTFSGSAAGDRARFRPRTGIASTSVLRRCESHRRVGRQCVADC